jgi:hypothetical protein
MLMSWSMLLVSIRTSFCPSQTLHKERQEKDADKNKDKDKTRRETRHRQDKKTAQPFCWDGYGSPSEESGENEFHDATKGWDMVYTR